MDSFEELPLSPELVESLAAEGLEVPTPLQVDAIPVVSRGNNLVAVAGPGAGVLVATAVPLLGRLEPTEGRPVALIATATASRAVHLAEALGRHAPLTGHRVAALDGAFALAENASFVVGSITTILERVQGGFLSVEGLEAVVIDDAAALEASDRLGEVNSLLDAVPAGAQRVMIALPFTPGLDEVVNRHFGRVVRVPPGAQDTPDGPDRGRVLATPVEDGEEETLVRMVADALDDDTHHCVVYVRSEDRAADIGDHLTLRGFLAGRPGDAESPVWMAVDALEARAALDAAGSPVALISLDVPADEDELDRRHGAGRGGRVLVAPRELPHLRLIARKAGYRVEVARSAAPVSPSGGLARMLGRVEKAIAERDVDVHQTALEPLFDRYGAPTVAAALLALLRETPAATPVAADTTGGGDGMTRLFISIGSRDGVGPGDLMGALTGESGVKGSSIGRIDLRESFSIVEVHEAVAPKIIKALNGTTIRGRSTRVDYDRQERQGGGSRGGPRGGGGGPRGGGGGPRGGGGGSRGGAPRGGGGGPRRGGGGRKPGGS